MRIWIKNTDGKQDAVLTMAVLGFLVILVKLLLVGVSFVVGDSTVNFGQLDAAVIAAVLTPTLGAYVARRYTDRKYKCPLDADRVVPATVAKDSNLKREE